jgi:bacterioferritin-associated ferredoxin
MYVCVCNAVTERQIRACAEQGACTLADLEECLGVGAGCGRCKPVAHGVLSETRGSADAPLAAVAA